MSTSYEAVDQANTETGIKDLPATCPWSIDQALGPDFSPIEGISPDSN